MDSIVDHAAMRGANRYGRPFPKLSPHAQVTVLLDCFGLCNMRRAKLNGSKTKKLRAYGAHAIVEDLRSAGYHIKSVLNFNDRHVRALLDAWRSAGPAPATLANRLSILRWFTVSIGKAGIVRAPEDYGIAPHELRCSRVATGDKSWSTRGTVAEAKIMEVLKLDEWAGTHLSLMRAFGLRLTEAILMKPRASHHEGDSLRVEEGTKGGRTRVIRIRTEGQRQVLEHAKLMSLRTRTGSLVPPGKTPEQARQRLYYVCRKAGITKAELEITPHGLRHEYANDLYESVSGTPSAVRGHSEILDRAADEAARAAVTADLGHARLQITAAYTGPRKRFSKAGGLSSRRLTGAKGAA